MLYRAPAITHLASVFALIGVAVSTSVRGAAYVSGVGISGTTVNFILNEPADLLAYSINGGPVMVLDGSTNGSKSFDLTSPTDYFQIAAVKSDTVGYTIPTGTMVPSSANGLSQSTAGGGFRLISDDTNNLNQFFTPRGVTVATNPNNPQFGTTYISNGTSGTTTSGRAVQKGLYAVKADQSDAFGKGNAATTTTFENATSNVSPYRLTVGGDHNVYIADWSDGAGGVVQVSPTMDNAARVFAGIGGPPTLPAGQNHGSVTSVFVKASASGITAYTIDEDLTSRQFSPTGSTTDKNSLWQYDIGTTALPYAGTPTRIAGPLNITAGVINDFDIGANGVYYLAQLRSAGGDPGIVVLSADGVTTLFDSLTATRALSGNSTTPDIFTNVAAIAVSPDQKYLAVMLNNSDVAVMTLDANGVPDLSSRLVIDTGADAVSGRDITFDAAGNIHYVSQGQQLYRVLAPGGSTTAITSYNGSSYEFVVVPEPTSGLLAGAGALGLLARRRRS